MVAVVSGNGLGLDNSSLRQLGLALGGQATIGQGSVASYLNAANGNLVLETADEGLIVDGLSLAVLRSYNSQGQLSGQQDWQFGFSRAVGGLTGTLGTVGSTITRTGDDGTAVIYTYNSSLGQYISSGQSGASDTLAWDAASSTWTWADAASSQQETYDAGGQLTTLQDTQTGAQYSFSHTSGRLSQIAASDGDTLTFTYNAINQLTDLSIEEIPPGQTTAVTRQQVAYTYDTQGRLATVTTTLASDTDSTAASYTTIYDYDGTSDRVAQVSQSDGTIVSYRYTADAQGVYQVTGITAGTGAAAQVVTLSYASGSTTVTDALGQATTYTYNAAGELIQVAAPAVNGSRPTTSYQYDGNGNLLTSIDATGAATTRSYDARGNLLSMEDATGHTVSNTYNATDQILSQTVYTVAAQGVVGQSGYVAPSGAQTTYYVYDAGNRLSYVVDPLGYVTESDYTTVNGLTVLSSTRRYLGASVSLVSLSPTTPPSLASLQAWVASAPVQSTLAQSTRTDYTYDVRGQLATQTRWDTVNSSGVGVLDVGTSIVTSTYDAQGRLLQTATERGTGRTTRETSSYAYDGLGRLLSSTDPLGYVTTYVYTDSGDTLAINQADGLTTTQVRNSAGHLISSTQSAIGQTSRVTNYLYDAAGQNVAVIDPAGNASYTFYDADGRVAGMVDATGAVTAYAYDADGRVVGTTQYATLISTSSWISGGALTANFPTNLPVPTAATGDRASQVIRDAAGRPLATIDAAGYVTATTYDGAGHAISHTAYATALTSAQLIALGSTPTWAALQANLTMSAADRTAYAVVDADGRAVATIDAAGYVTTTAYDAAGHAIKMMAYATALTTAQLAALGSTPNLVAVQTDLTTNASDQTTRTYYDGDDRAVAQVDADGYLTTTAVDETTHTATTTRYAMALTTAQLTALTGSESVATLVGLLGATPASQVSTTTTNADNQIASATAVDGTVTTYSYNTEGRLLSTTVTPAAGQGTARTTRATYDAFGDTLTQVDGAQATTTYTYNALGQRLTATDALGNVSYTYYDADGRVAYTVQGQPNVGTRNGLGNVTAYTYNAFGQLTSTRQYASQLTLTGGTGSGTTLNPTTATLTEVAAAVAALPVSASDADGLTTYTYTLDGRVASVTDGLGYQTASTYDAFGERIQVQQQLSAPGSAPSADNSTISTFVYDGRGEQVGITAGVGSTVARSTSQTYDAFGRVTSITDGDGHTVTYDYDNLGRQVGISQTVSGAARTAQTTYDAFDRVVTQTDALGNVTSYQYNLAAHTTIVTTPDGVAMTTVRDALGDTVSVADGAGDTTTYAYDADGRLIRTTDALGNVSTNQYDLDGELIQTTDASSHEITYSYDASGRVLTRTVDPSGLALTSTYRYDGEGRTLSVTDPAGVVTAYTYDATGHMLTQVQDVGAGKLNLTTTTIYDGAGRTLTVTVGADTSAARTTQYVYDNLERLSQQIVDPGSGHLNLTTTYAYDANNNLIRVTDANGHVTRRVYNEANALTFTLDPTGAVTQTWYDADGRVTQTRGYVTALTGSQLATLGTSPTAAQLAALVSNTNFDSFHQTAYNGEGRPVYELDGVGLHTTQLSYDAAGRLVQTTRYATLLSQAPAGTAPTAAAIAALVVTSAADETTLTTYDADGRARFTVQTNTVSGQLVGEVSERRYDAAGRIIAASTYGATIPLSTGQSLITQVSTSSLSQALAGAPRETTQTVYDGAGQARYTIDATDHVIETQYDPDGRVTAQFAYANPIVVPATLTLATLATAVTAAGITGERFTTTTYDAAGRVHTTGDALGVTATFVYDATGLQTGRADRDGNWVWSVYDKAGRQILVQSPPVTVGSYSGGLLQTMANQYLYTSTTYDGVGNVTAISRGAGASANAITTLSTTSYAYDAANHQIQTTYPGGVSTHVVYNALGQAVADQDANGHWQYKTYISLGKVSYSVDADGYVTLTGYDAFGNIDNITRYATPLNTAAIAGWSAGQPLTTLQLLQGMVTSGSDRTITTIYDQRNRKTQVLQPVVGYGLAMGPLAGTVMAGAAPTTTYTYDAYGNVTSTSTLLQGASGTGASAVPALWATTYMYYDALNRAVMTVIPTGSYTSPQGYVTTTAYSAFSDVVGVTQYATAIATTAITAASAPAAPATSTYDRVSTIAYDAAGRKTSQTDTGAVSYAGGTVGQLTGTAGLTRASHVTSYTYDGENRVLTVTVNGATTTTVYDAAGRVASVTAPARLALVGNWAALLESTPGDDLTTAALYTSVSPVTSFVYDALGHALSTTVSAPGDLTEQTLATYDARGNALTVTDAKGYVTTSTYDGNGNVLTQSDTLTGNTTSSTVTATYQYDGANQQTLTQVQRSGQSGYDSYTQVKYNAFGEVTDKGDNTGLEAHYSYDNAGHLLSAPDSITGAIHTYAYDLAGHLVVDSSTVTGGGGTTWTHQWLDLAGRAVEIRTPSDRASSGVDTTTQITRSYDRWGNVLALTDANGNTTTTSYDSQNHLIGQTEASVLVVSATGVRAWQTPTRTWYYNVAGELMGATDENGNTAWNTYDAAGHVTVAQDATGAKTVTAYGGLGNALAQQTPPANTATGPVAHITFTTYDTLNQITQQGDFQLSSAGTARTLQAQETYLLDSQGNRLQVIDALGNTAYYGYDSQHRVLSSQTPIQHVNGWSDAFTYDANGHKTDETTANGDHQAWVVDYFGRVQSHTDLSGALTTYTYDASSGLLISVASAWVPAGQANPGYLAAGWNGATSTQNTTYYANGQVAQLTDYVNGVAQSWDAYQYDANGNTIVDNSWGSDGTGQQRHMETLSQYDSHNRLSEVTTEDTSTSAIESREVTDYDAAGNRRAVFVQSAYGPTAAPISGNGGAPTTSAIGTQVATAGQGWSLAMAGSFVDNIGFGLTFTATQSNGTTLPSWMTFNSNGNFTGVPTTAGSWTVTVTATDVNGQSASTTFTVTVPVAAPVFSAAPFAQVGNVGTAVSFPVPGAVDANGSSLVYSASYFNGSTWVSTLPPWMTFNPVTLVFNGTPPAGSVGTYTLGVTATAANGGTASESFTFTVLSTPPVLNGSFSNQTVFGAHAFAFSFSTSAFTEADGSALTYSAGQYQMVPQGEGFPPEEQDSPLPTWMTFYPDSVTFTGTPPASTVGQTFKLYATGTNPQGQYAEGYFTLTVAPYVQPAPVYNGGLPNRTGVIGGASLNIPLPTNTFSESDGGALTYTGMVLIPQHELDYPVNGGTDVATRTVAAQWVPISTVGLSINATTGTLTGVPTTLDYVTSTYGSGATAHDTAYQLEIIATNGQGAAVSGTFGLANTFAPPTLAHALANVSANPGQGWLLIVQSTTFTDPAGYGLTYTASLSSGAALPGGLVWSGAYLSVGAVAAGSYAIKVTATDSGTASSTFTLTVANAAPVLGAPSNLTGVAGTAMAAYQAPLATDANGDAITYSATGMPAGITFNAATRTFSGTPSTAGTSTITYTATDSQGAAVHATFTIAVSPPADQPPIYHGGISEIQFTAGQTNSWTVPSGAITNPAGRALSYTLVRQDGSAFPAGYSFNTTTGTLSTTALPSTKVDRSLGNVVLTATDPVDGMSVTVVTDVYVTANLAGTNMVAGAPLDTATLASSPSDGSDGTMLSMQTAVAGTPNIQSYWFTYDADNRVVVSNGALVGGQVQVAAGTYADPSSANQYDAAGNVVVRSTLAAGVAMNQRLVYDARNELVETDYANGMGVQQRTTYDGAGRQQLVETYFRSDSLMSTYGTGDFPNAWVYLSDGGWLADAQITSYNADGAVQAQSSYQRSTTIDWQRAAILRDERGDPQPDEVDIALDGTGPLVQGSTTTYTGYDHADNVTAYAFTSYLPTAFGATYTVQYLKKDGYLEQSTTGTPAASSPGYVPAVDTSYYDAFGRRTAVSQTSQASSGAAQNVTRIFGYDTAGEIVQRRSGAVSGSTFTATGGYGTDHYTYVNGQQLSDMNEAGDINVLGTLTGFSSGDSASNYVVQSGDTLASIAQAVYGNSNYGYIVAEANGLTDDSGLVVGQAISLPSVTTHANTATTFKPYNPSEVVGSTTPNLPAAPPPPPSQAGCSGLAQIVMIAVVVVASIYTAGAAAEMFSASAAATGSAWTAGMAALGGSYGAAGLGAAAIGGFVGSAAGQLAGDAMGIHQGFSLGEAMVGGLTAGATAGIGGEISSAGSDFSMLANANGTLRPAGAALLGAGSYAANVAANEVTGQSTRFSWAGVAASMVAAGVTAEGKLPNGVLQKMGVSSGSFGEDLAGGLMSGGLNREASKLLGDDRVGSWASVGEDAFGNALGNAAIAEMRSTNTGQSGYQFDFTKAGTGVGGSLGNASITGTSATQQTMPDFRAQDQQEMQDEMDAELLDRTGQLPDVVLSSGDQGRLATTTPWPFAYVDPYAIARNDGVASGVEYTQTFRLPDEAPATFTDLNQAAAPVAQGSALDQMLVAISNSAQGYRDLSRQNLDNSSSPGWAALNAGIYAINSVSSAVVGGFAQTARILTNGDVRQQFAQGIETLATTDPRTTATAAWDHWSSLSTEDQLIQGASILATLGGGAASKVGDVGTLANDVRNLDEVAGASNAATSIGKSGYASVQDFSDAALVKYQSAVDEGYSRARQALQDGTLPVPAGIPEKTVLGQATDTFARTSMRDWLADEGIGEGQGQLIQVNRYLYDPAGSGSYRIPDVSIPGANQIYDATLGFKSWSTPQIRRFYQYSNGGSITIVRPTQLGGSYSVLVPH